MSAKRSPPRDEGDGTTWLQVAGVVGVGALVGVAGGLLLRHLNQRSRQSASRYSRGGTSGGTSGGTVGDDGEPTPTLHPAMQELFEPRGVLGAGSFATVINAVVRGGSNNGSGREAGAGDDLPPAGTTVAIKIIKTRGKINLVADARDECEVLRSLDHPNIMKMWVRGGRQCGVVCGCCVRLYAGGCCVGLWVIIRGYCGLCWIGASTGRGSVVVVCGSGGGFGGLRGPVDGEVRCSGAYQ